MELVGHVNLIGKYPEWVAPVVRDDRGVVSIAYCSEDGVRLVEPSKDADVVWHDRVELFDCRRQRLWAYSEDYTVVVDRSDVQIFIRKLLSNDAVARDNPFLRLTLAEESGNFSVIFGELCRCEDLFNNQYPDQLASWKMSKMASLLITFDFGNLIVDTREGADFEQFLSELPAAFEAYKSEQEKIQFRLMRKLDDLEEDVSDRETW